MWRKIVAEMQAKDYPEIELNNFYVDNCAMQLVLNPKQFDVILTNNIFGDILSDEASTIAGSIGLLPSASLGDGTGMYELSTAAHRTLPAKVLLTRWQPFSASL